MTPRSPHHERERGTENRRTVRPSWIAGGLLVAAFVAAWALYGSHLFTILGRIGLSLG